MTVDMKLLNNNPDSSTWGKFCFVTGNNYKLGINFLLFASLCICGIRRKLPCFYVVLGYLHHINTALKTDFFTIFALCENV